MRELNPPSPSSPRAPVIVLKFGGSVLRDESDLARGVAEIARWLAEGKRVVAVVSAFEGTTDSLLARVRAVDPAHTPESHPDALALLLATGEFTTAALLTLALAKAGVEAALLGPHSLSLRTRGSGADADPASIDLPALERALDESPVVVVPGFVGVGSRAQLTLLGRGGSDLTALYLAAELGARCRLIKDVDGLYERDPALAADEPPPRRFLTLSWNDALALDGGIVQHKAVRFAQERGLIFEVGSFARHDVSTVGPYRATWHGHAAESEPCFTPADTAGQPAAPKVDADRPGRTGFRDAFARAASDRVAPVPRGATLHSPTR